MKQYVLNDPILSDLSSCHIRSVLKLSKQAYLRGLLSHHGRESCDLACLVFFHESFEL